MIEIDYLIWQLPVDESGAIEFFQEKGLIRKELNCSKDHPMKLQLSTKSAWRCYNRSCRQTRGIRTNTWFENSRIPFLTALRFIYFWCMEMTSIEFCEIQLKMNHNTTVDWNNFMREVCINSLVGGEYPKIGGKDLTVEIDESLFTRRKNNVGRVLPAQWVFGGICRETKQCFLVTVEDRSATTLFEAIISNVAYGSIIHSDCWRGYKTEDLENAGFNHLTVNHKYNFVDPDTGCHTQNVERMWGNAKTRNKRQRGTSRKHLESYLVEYMWRNQNPKTTIFTAMLNAILEFMPPTN
jgi:transposase-like protein